MKIKLNLKQNEGRLDDTLIIENVKYFRLYENFFLIYCKDKQYMTSLDNVKSFLIEV